MPGVLIRPRKKRKPARRLANFLAEKNSIRGDLRERVYDYFTRKYGEKTASLYRDCFVGTFFDHAKPEAVAIALKVTPDQVLRAVNEATNGLKNDPEFQRLVKRLTWAK